MRYLFAIVLFLSSVAFAWNLESKRDSFSGQNQSFIWVRSEEGGAVPNAIFGVRCKSYEPTGFDIIFMDSANLYMGSRFDYRIDDQEAVLDVNGIRSDGRDGIFFRDDLVIRVLSGELFGNATNFAVRTWDIGGKTIVYNFNVSGWNEAFRQVASCKR